MLSRWTYPEILDRLEALREYLTKQLKVAHIPDRLCGAIANVRELDQARRENRLEHLVSSNDPASDRRVQELVWSIVEGQQLATIFEGIHDGDPKIVRRPLLKGLKGPVHPIDETGSTNVGRNTIFELVLNTMFRRAGARVTIGGEEADLKIDHAGARLYIECKRPLFGDNILKNVSKARHQLQERFKKDQRSSEPSNEVGGLVAISISKALNSGLKMFTVDEEEGLKGLGNDIISIRQQYRDDHNRQDDPRLVGMIYHLFTPAYFRNTGLLTCASETHVITVTESFQETFPTSGEPLYQLLQDLRNRQR